MWFCEIFLYGWPIVSYESRSEFQAAIGVQRLIHIHLKIVQPQDPPAYPGGCQSHEPHKDYERQDLESTITQWLLLNTVHSTWGIDIRLEIHTG